jgi:Ca2+-binding RTX toxin-like protein
MSDNTYIVDDIYDEVEDTNGGTDTVISYINTYVLPDNIENLTLDAKFNLLDPSKSKIGRHAIGNDLDNIMNGNNFNNNMRGEDGDDIIFSGAGSDAIRGGEGDDYLWGVGVNLGQGEIDELIGNEGRDTFVLGSESQNRVFYMDGNPANVGFNDYALIRDFEFGMDKLVLYSSSSNPASNYSTLTVQLPEISGQGTFSGQGIFYKSLNNGQYTYELVAVLAGVTSQELPQGFLSNSNYVTYVS